MIHFIPNSKYAARNMFKRVGVLLILIFLLLFLYLPNFTIYGGWPFTTYEEAISYYYSAIWGSLTDGNFMLLPVKLIFLPFVLTWNCHRPGCTWAELLFIVVYYTFWFYMIKILPTNFLKKRIERSYK